MNTRILIAVVVSMFVCQQVHAQDDPEAAVTELEGTWEMVSCMIDGEQIENFTLQLQFEGHRLHCRFFGTGLASGFSVDPSAMPATIDNDTNVVFSIDTNSLTINNPSGIYELDDDSLTICVPHDGNYVRGPRPDRFESSEDNPTFLIVLRRVEDDGQGTQETRFRPRRSPADWRY